MDVQRAVLVLILICFVQLLTGQTPSPSSWCWMCQMRLHFYVCVFPAHILCGRLSKYPIDIPSPLCSMLSHTTHFHPTVRQCAACLEDTANQTIFPIMLAAKRVPVTSKDAFFFRTGLDRGAFVSTSQANHTRVSLEANRDHLFREVCPADLVRNKVRWLHLHPH